LTQNSQKKTKTSLDLAAIDIPCFLKKGRAGQNSSTAPLILVLKAAKLGI